MGNKAEAIPVACQKMTDSGPGRWWFVYHPDGFLIECGTENIAEKLSREINAGRRALAEEEGRSDVPG